MIAITSVRTLASGAALATYTVNGSRAASFIPRLFTAIGEVYTWLMASITEGAAAAAEVVAKAVKADEPVEHAPTLPRTIGVGRANRPNRAPDKDGHAVITTCAHAGWSKGWLAKLEDLDTKYGFARSFERATDRSGLSRAGNGVICYEVGPGVYEAESVYKSGCAYRYYLLVHLDGGVEEITKDQARELLAR